MNNKMIIGISGGIGAGKSTVLSWIGKHYIVKIISADEVGHELMQPGGSVYDALIREYGSEILRKDGTVWAQKLAEICFKTEESRKRINGIEHPLIREEIIRRIENADEKVIFVEAALLKEGKLDVLCDEIWAVTAPKEERIRRLMAGRGYSEEKCLSVIEKQAGDEEYASTADIVIENCADFSETVQEIEKNMKRTGALHAL